MSPTPFIKYLSTTNIKIKKTMRFIVFILIAFFLVFLSCKNDSKFEYSAQKQDISEWVFAPGQLDWDEEYNLTAQSEGTLLGAQFDIGTNVIPGQVIATIDNPSSGINTATSQDQFAITNQNLSDDAPALQHLKQNIAFAEAKYQQDKVFADRYERLFNKGSIARVEFENAQLAAENALSNLNALKKQYDVLLQQALQQNIATRGQLKNAQIIQSYNQVKVIKGGTIIKKFKSTGDYVRKGDIIASVANPNKIEVVLNVDENSIRKIRVGQAVKFQLNSNREEVLSGKVSEILSTFDQSTQSFICKILPDEPLSASENIYGSPLEGNVLVNERKGVLVIPRSYMGYGNKVSVKGQKERRTIKTGIVSTEFVEVIDGLTTDDILLPLKP
jgi:multidrug efflux pump subunit AcrA (membrane-fusion protein)